MHASEGASLPHISRGGRPERGPLGRGATIAWLTALVVVVGGLVAYFNTKITGYILDETVIKQSAIHYTSGLPDTLLHDPDARATSRLYSLLVSPLFAAMHGDQAIQAARALNGLLFASTAVPVFLLARTALSRRRALLAGGLAITLPWLILSTALFTESLAYPLAMWSLVAMAWAWRRPHLLSDVVVLASIGLATGTRVQFASLFAVYGILILWRLATLDRPALTVAGLLGALRTFPVTAALVALGLVFLAARGLGVTHAGPSLDSVLGSSYAATTTNRTTVPSNVGLGFAVQVLLLALGTGILPLVLALAWLPDALRAKVTRTGPSAVAILSVAATVGIWAAIMYSQGGPIGPLTEERYYFYVAPLVWICAIVAAGTASVTPKRLLAWGAGLTLIALLVALPQGITTESTFFAPASAAWTWITGQLSTGIADATSIAGTGQLDLVAAAIALVVGLAALGVHLVGRRALPWAVVLGIGLQLLITAIVFAATNWRIDGWPGRTGDGAATQSFVDRTTGDRPATWIHGQPYDDSWAVIQRTALFFNDAIRQTASFPALNLTPVDFPMNSLPAEALTVRGDGSVFGGPPLPFVTPYAVQTEGSPFVQLRGRQLSRAPGLGLGVFDVGLHPRAVWYLTGLDPYAGLAPGVRARYRVWTTGATMAVTAETATQVRVRAGGRTRELAVPAGRTVELRLPGCTAPDGAVLSAQAAIKVLSVSPTGTDCPTP